MNNASNHKIFKIEYTKPNTITEDYDNEFGIPRVHFDKNMPLGTVEVIKVELTNRYWHP